MKRRYWFSTAMILGVSVLIAVAAMNTIRPTPTRTAVQAHMSRSALEGMGFAVSKPITHEGVTVVPIVSNNPRSIATDYATLAEAREKGWVEITEGAMTDFNGVVVANKGPKPILLVSGDLIVGGHQDRVIMQDTIIPPGETRQVEVFCVEAGRSTGPTNVFAIAEIPTPHRVRRAALFAQNQDRVWGAVSAFNAAAAASPATQTVQGGLNAEKVVAHVKKATPGLVDQLGRVKNAVGYVVIVNGRPDMVELFGDPDLFREASPQLLKGLAADQALRSGHREVDEREIVDYVAQVVRGERAKADDKDGYRRFEVWSQGAGVTGYELYRTDAKGIRYLVHGSYAR